MPKAKINGIDIYYEIHGDEHSNKCVSFFNGVAASVNGWYNQLDVFKKAGYKILLHDFRGQLFSEKPESPYSFEQNANDFLKLLDYLNIENTHIIGISYGGIVAIRFAALFPDRIRSLIGLNTLYKPDERLKLIDKSYITRYKNYHTASIRDYFLDFVPNSYSPEYLTKHQKTIEANLELVDQLPPDFLKSQIKMCQNFVDDNFDDSLLKRIQCPVLILASENDFIAYPYYSKQIVEKIPQSEFLIIPDCGHVCLVEKPQTVNSVIAGFILKNDLLQ